MACGIPLVSAPWDDAEHLFRPGTDYLVAATTDEMERHLDDILHDDELAASLRASGLETDPRAAHLPPPRRRAAGDLRRPRVCPGRSRGAAVADGLDIAYFGSSLVSSWWNGAATYYRGLLRGLAALGHRVTFYEPIAYDRQEHRDIDDPDWARVVVYAAEDEAQVRATVARAARRGRDREDERRRRVRRRARGRRRRARRRARPSGDVPRRRCPRDARRARGRPGASAACAAPAVPLGADVRRRRAGAAPVRGARCASGSS